MYQIRGLKRSTCQQFCSRGQARLELKIPHEDAYQRGDLNEWKDYNSVYSFLACGFLKIIYLC